MKKLIAVILCTSMIFGVGVVGVCAAEIGDTIRWDYMGNRTGYYIYELNGHLELGETFIPPVSDNEWDGDFDVVYEFEVEEAGCYLIDHRDTEGLEIAEIYENGYAYGFEEGSLPDDDGELIYWLDEGTALFGINVKEEGSTVSIKTYDGERPSLTYDAVYYIESVEIENFEYYTTSYELFGGTYSFANPMEDGAKITVNFKNGTSADVETYQTDDGLYSSIQVPIGDDGYYSYPVYAYRQRDLETSKLYFILSIDEHEHIKAEYTIIEKNIAANLERLEYLLESASWTMESTISEIFTMLKSFNFEGIFNNVGRFVSNFSWWIETVATDLFVFVKYFIF